MPNAQIAQLIATRMREGLMHPGDPEKGLPPKLVSFRAFQTKGLPKEMADLVNQTVQMMSEAIVHLIETEGDAEMVARGQVQRLANLETRTSGGVVFERPVPVHCSCDATFADPLMMLTVTDAPRIIVPGKQLIKGLSQREEKCPHGRKQ